MTAKRDLKKRIRARQAKTGESYTTARAHVLLARDKPPGAAKPEQVIGYVLKCNDSSLRLRVAGEEESVTLRCSREEAWRTAPAQQVMVNVTKRWRWRQAAYASGEVKRAWTDIPDLGFEPLPLDYQGESDLGEIHEPFVPPDPYAQMWEFLTSTPREAYEFDGIAWGAGVGVDEDEDEEACLVAEAADIARHDPEMARSILMGALSADLRCIDAHVHLGNLDFEKHPAVALTHYEIAIAIGDLSLGPMRNRIRRLL